jgi:hypothetical protein
MEMFTKLAKSVLITGILMAFLITGAWLILRKNNLKTFNNQPGGTKTSKRQKNFGPESIPANKKTEFNGILTVFNPTLIFRNTKLISSSENIEIQAKDFNLSLLGNDSLRVNEQYPMFDITLKGTQERTQDGYIYKFSELSPKFRQSIDGKQVETNDDTSKRLIEEMKNSSIILPTVSSSLPYVIKTKVNKKENSVQIISESNQITNFEFLEN